MNRNLDTDYLFELGDCVHKPLRPPRDGMVPENVFAEHWERFMLAPDSEDRPNGHLLDIRSPMPGKLTQRHATVAASFICWLGTNCGNSFINEGRRLTKMLGGWGAGFAAAWALENARRGGVNNGVRILEYMLAPADHFRPRSTFLDSGLHMLPELSVEDYEVVEHIVVWLADPDGETFVRGCEEEIERRRRLAWNERRAPSAPVPRRSYAYIDTGPLETGEAYA